MNRERESISDMEELPKTPNDKPRWDFEEERHQIRNWMVGDLESFDSVEITFETDESACESEARGMWTVELCKHNKWYYAEHKSFVNAMWYCLDHANAVERESFLKWESDRAAALSKLTPEEQRLLNLR